MSKPQVGSVEEFLLLWTQRLPAEIKAKQVKRWLERDESSGFTLKVRWSKEA